MALSAALAKLGQFSFSEQDLVLPLNGIPLTVTRKYNSLNPRSGDFGYMLADAGLIHYAMGACEKAEEEATRKAVAFSTTARRGTVDWSGLPCEAGFWDAKLGPKKNLPYSGVTPGPREG